MEANHAHGGNITADTAQQWAAAIKGNWTDADRAKFADWNKLHDLHDRLINRLQDNYSDYQHWHFEEFGWCAI